MKAGRLFPIADHPTLDELRALGIEAPGAYSNARSNVRAESTGRFAQVPPGGWYISGAFPEGYRAPNGTRSAYFLARLVRVESVTTTRVVRRMGEP
jgi:hypothetical protein